MVIDNSDILASCKKSSRFLRSKRHLVEGLGPADGPGRPDGFQSAVEPRVARVTLQEARRGRHFGRHAVDDQRRAVDFAVDQDLHRRARSQSCVVFF